MRSVINTVLTLLVFFLTAAHSCKSDAQNFVPTQLQSVNSCPGIVFPGRVYVIPHLTTSKDSLGQNFVSAIALLNQDDNASTATICAFTSDGLFVGGSDFGIPAYGRFYAVSPAATGVMNLADFLLPVRQPLSSGPGSGAGGGGIPSDKDIHVYMNNSCFSCSVSAGFVGNSGQFLAFHDVGTTSSSPNTFSHVGSGGGFDTVFYVTNPSNKAGEVVITSYDEAGNVKTTSPRMAIAGLSRLTLTASQLGITSMRSVRIEEFSGRVLGTLAVIVYPTSAIGGASISIQTPTNSNL